MDEDRMELYGNERRLIEYLTAVDHFIQRYSEDIKPRLKLIRWGWRDFRNVSARLDNLLRQIYDTMSVKDLTRLDKLCRNGEILIRPRRAASLATEYMTVECGDLEYVAVELMRERCGMCLADGGEIRRCELRRHLFSMCPPPKKNRIGCEYRDMLAELK